MEKRSFKGRTVYVRKGICRSVRAGARAEYYDQILLLVRAKFAEIVKVGETIKDGLKTGKIARVAVSPESSCMLKKKREEIAAVSYWGKEKP